MATFRLPLQDPS